MIVVLFGQPHSGKTTLAEKLAERLIDSEIIDGDKFREAFKNTDYSKEGRIKNLTKACDIGYYMHKNLIKSNIIYSMVFPYKEVRNYLKELHPDVYFFYLMYQKPRGREEYHVKDFEAPIAAEKIKILNTDNNTIDACIDYITDVLWKKNGEN
jgi:adenylylsulfate kinase-like enzyme